MLQEWCSRMRRELHERTGWNLSRCECLANMVCAVISARSVRLDDLAAHIPGKAQFRSKTRRLQQFFLKFGVDQNALALMLVSILGRHLKEKWILAVDRTNWTRRGNEVNLLTLSVCMGDVAMPLFWDDLGHKGNSNTAQRIALMTRFLKVFGAEQIEALTGDREFVGADWFRWLKKARIPFVLRIRENFKVMGSNGRETEVQNCFRNLKLYEQRTLGVRKICGVSLCLSGLRLPGNEYVILVSHGVTSEEAFSLYRERWRIETLFQKLKGHGFDLESSRLRGEGKAETLMAVLALAAAWCYAFGKWHVKEVDPLRIQKHGRPEKAVFRRGLDILRQVFNGCATQLARLSRVALGLLRSMHQPMALNLE